MKYILDGKEYNVIITKKNNKNTYIRVKNGDICVTTNHFGTKIYIKSLLDKNKDALRKMINKDNEKTEINNNFYYLGKVYDVIIVPSLDIQISDNMILVKSEDYLNKWLKKQIINIYKERLDIIYNLFEEKIPYPNLKIRKMTTRWGVCNRKNNNVTLNSELIKYGIEQIDYVIVHELSHFVHFNHSKDFWTLVSKYCPDYKKVRKSLK